MIKAPVVVFIYCQQFDWLARSSCNVWKL